MAVQLSGSENLHNGAVFVRNAQMTFYFSNPVWLYRLHDSGIGHINILIYKPHIFQSESNKSNFSLILFNF